MFADKCPYRRIDWARSRAPTAALSAGIEPSGRSEDHGDDEAEG